MNRVTTASFRVKPGGTIRLQSLDPGDTGSFARKKDAVAPMAADLDRLRELQERFYVDGRFALLLVLQGMDTSGKDGTIRHLSGALNLAGAEVTSFKAPSSDELEHDFLWRVHHKVPARRRIGIFNRSQYEDVLIVRVRRLVPDQIWQSRYEQINAFEEILSKNDVIVLKCFLHIGKDEQKKRLLARLDDPAKLWKFNRDDLATRALWDSYQEAYEAALAKCSTERAPWHIIPANHKWYRNFSITRLMVETLERLHLELPTPSIDPKSITLE